MQVAPLELWTFGLTDAEKSLLLQCAGEEYSLLSLDGMKTAEIADLTRNAENNEPLLLWLGSSTWFSFCAQCQELVKSLELFPRVLLLEQSACETHVHQAFEGHYQQIVHGPLAETHVFDALSRAREASNMFMDMSRMTRELMLGRELLARKSEVFSMLFSFFASTAKAKNVPEWLAACQHALSNSLGMEGVHLAWWGKNIELGRTYSVTPPTVFFLGLPEHSPMQGAWHKYLQDRASTLMPGLENSACACVGSNNMPDSIMPEAAHVLLVPLGQSSNNISYGFLALHLSNAFKPGRDIAQAFEIIANYTFYFLMEKSRKLGGEFFATHVSASKTQEKAAGI